MTKRRWWLGSTVAYILVGMAFPAVSFGAQQAPPVDSSAQREPSRPIVIYEAKHDVSPPLREIPPVPVSAVPPRVIPLRLPPVVPPGSGAPEAQDPVVQNTVGPLVGTTNFLNFDGTSADGFAPPDTNGSVGATQFVQTVNIEYAVYSKTNGALLLGPVNIATIWSGFGGLCETGSVSDPIVLYDKAAGRWLISQIAFNGNFSSNLMCIAVSTTSDATGSFARYGFSFGNNLPDYPKFGVWPDAYYFSANTFVNGSFFLGAQACAFNRSAMLAGASATAICFQESTSVASLLPSDLDGATAPPSGEPNFYLDLGTNSLNLFKFHVDFTTPSNSTFTGPTNLPVASFNQACNGGTCIPQAGTGQKLDSLGDRLMFRLAYRNFTSFEALVVNHSVRLGPSRKSQTGVRWYEIRSPNGTPTVFEQATYAPDSNFRWMGSIAEDKVGDIAVGYSVSSGSIHPEIHYTGRVPSDPLNTLEAESTIIDGTGSQTGGLSRWGDYSSMSLDPSDDCNFWYTTEYLVSDGSFNWHTRIASFKFPSCQ